MGVGAFGLGGGAIKLSSSDDIMNLGVDKCQFIYASSGDLPQNVPDGVGSYFEGVYITRGTTAAAVVIIHDNNQQQWSIRISGGDGEWQKILSSTDIGTAATKDVGFEAGNILTVTSDNDDPYIDNFHSTAAKSGISYRWTSGSANGPPISGGGGAIRLDRGGNCSSWLASAAQGAKGTNDPHFYVKSTSATASDWGAWREVILTSNIVGSVVMSGGKPSGSVISSGTNPNGRYTKFADGTMITVSIWTGTVDILRTDYVTAGYRSVSSDISHPATFADTPVVVVSNNWPTSSCEMNNHITVAYSQSSYCSLCFANVSRIESAAVSVNIVAYGRWTA